MWARTTLAPLLELLRSIESDSHVAQSRCERSSLPDSSEYQDARVKTTVSHEYNMYSQDHIRPKARCTALVLRHTRQDGNAISVSEMPEETHYLRFQVLLLPPVAFEALHDGERLLFSMQTV